MLINKTTNKYLKKYWLPILIGIIALFVLDMVQVKIPNIVGDIVDGLTEGTYTFDDVVSQVLNILLFVAIIVTLRVTWRLTIIGSARRISYRIRNDMFKHVETLDQEFFSTHKTGDLMAYFTNDLTNIERALSWATIMFLDFLFLTPAIIISMLNNVERKLVLIICIPIFFVPIVIFILGKKLKAYAKETQDSYSRMSDFVQENVSGIEVIKAFCKEEDMKEKYTSYSKDHMKRSIKTTVLDNYLDTIVVTLISTSLGFVFLFGYFAVLNGEAGVGDIVTLMQLVFLLFWPVQAIGMAAAAAQRGNASLARINYILHYKSAVVSKPEAVKHLDNFDIRFNNLTFYYENETKPAVENLSFEIKQGEFVGIVGRVGSGKSTISKLLMRLYNIEEDTLYIGNEDLMDLDVQFVRDNVSFSPQINYLFYDTIKNNLKFGDFSIEDDVIEEYSKHGDLYENIQRFNNKFETLVGEKGVTLSGGQKQRLSIIRALILNKEILILDDSVSAVDTKTEETILKNLFELRKGKTTIIIANRISTVEKADKIILLDEGKIDAIGPHKELLEKSELYNTIVGLQQLVEEK